MLIFMQTAPPLGAIGYIIDNAGVGDVHAIAALTGVIAQLLFGKFAFGCWVRQSIIPSARMGRQYLVTCWACLYTVLQLITIRKIKPGNAAIPGGLCEHWPPGMAAFPGSRDNDSNADYFTADR